MVRDITGFPVYLGSSFRSQKWDISKGRSGEGDHPKGKGVDINGKNVVDVILAAINEKNHLFQELSKIGINAFGIYEWGVHLGKRTPKANGKIYYWDERKKKTRITL